MNIYRDDIQSPVGTLAIVSDDISLRALHFIDHADDAERLYRLLRAQFGTVEFRVSQARLDVRGRLASYFAGDLHALDAVPTRPSGTAFQIAVWAALRTIPVGATMSYGQLARALGAPKATRAVGLANGANPIAIVIPCHRVIGADGTLTGYGGGLERKAWLLRHEGVAFGRSRPRSDRELPLFT